MNGTLVRATALALLSMLLAGCGGGDGDATPTFSSTPTPTAQTTSASPVTSSSSPATEETPEAFIRRWILLQTQMQNSGQSGVFRLASGSCTACLGLADLVDEYYTAGGYIKTLGWRVQALTCRVTGAAASCQASIKNAATTYKTSASAATTHLHGGPFKETFDATLANGGWTMSRIAELAS